MPGLWSGRESEEGSPKNAQDRKPENSQEPRRHARGRATALRGSVRDSGGGGESAIPLLPWSRPEPERRQLGKHRRRDAVPDRQDPNRLSPAPAAIQLRTADAGRQPG